MGNDCWGGDSMYVNPYCPVCKRNVVGHMWPSHVRDEHGGVSPRPAGERLPEDD
jgi:hypothetical protein